MRAYCHFAIGFTAIAVQLLGYDATEDHLLGCLVREKPAGISHIDWVLGIRQTIPPCISVRYSGLFRDMPPGNETTVLPVVLLGLIDNCSSPYPKLAMNGTSLLSMLLSRRPAAVISLLDPIQLSGALYKYLKTIFRLVSNAECIVEERFGIAAFINALPTLYLLSENPVTSKHLHNLPASVATIAINIVHSISGSPAAGCPNDLKRLPELWTARVDIRPILVSGIAAEVMTARPMTYAVAGAIEVRWSWHMSPRSGIRVSPECMV